MLYDSDDEFAIFYTSKADNRISWCHQLPAHEARGYCQLVAR